MPPLNLVGDFGGGGMLLAFGLVCGIVHAQQHRRGPGGRRRDGRRRRHPDDDVPRLPRHGHLGGRAGHATCSTRARTSTTCTRRPTASTCRSARSSRSSTPSSCGSPASRARSCPSSTDKAQWPAMKDRLAAIFQTQDPRRVVRDHGGHRRVLRPGAVDGRGAAAPAQRPPRHLRRARRRRAAGARARASPRTRRRRSSGRRRTPGSTPTRCCAEWGFDADRIAKLRDAGAVA